MVPKLTQATIDLWTQCKNSLLPTSKFHYIFNLRDISRIFGGMLQSPSMDREEKAVTQTVDQLVTPGAMNQNACSLTSSRTSKTRSFSTQRCSRLPSSILAMSTTTSSASSSACLTLPRSCATTRLTPRRTRLPSRRTRLRNGAQRVRYPPAASSSSPSTTTRTRPGWSDRQAVPGAYGLGALQRAMEYMMRIAHHRHAKGSALLAGVGGSAMPEPHAPGRFLQRQEVYQIEVVKTTRLTSSRKTSRSFT